MIPRWWSSAPLGNPVVPDVYWIWAGSPGATSGRPTPGDAGARNSFQPVMSAGAAASDGKRIASRRPGSSGRTSSRKAAIGLRNSGTRKMPEAPDWRST